VASIQAITSSYEDTAKGTPKTVARGGGGGAVGVGDPEIGRKPIRGLCFKRNAIRWISFNDPYDSQSSSVTPPDLRRYRAERLLRKEFEAMRGKVLTVVRAQLRGKGIALAAADLEACYAQAWHGLYASLLEGERIENPAGWLVRVAFRRAVDEHRAARATRVGEREGEGSYPPSFDAPQDLVGALDDKARLRHLFEALRTHLSGREREAASLCYLQGLSRAQAAERMGVSEARMRKLMEGGGAGKQGVAAKMGELLDLIAAGGWCEEQSSLMKAYAFGILDPEGERYALAVAHCKQCPACRAHVASLRGLASVLPLPLLPELASGGSGVAHGATAKASSSFSGSLAVKLAVTAVVVLGAGYGILGTRAPGNTPVPRLTARPVVGKPLRPATRAPHREQARTRRAVHLLPRRQLRSTPATASTGRAPAYEFGPERVTGGSSSARISSSPSSPSSRGSAGEFGLE
jgi:RNA polymerase sigma-70 factor (ECF subfamily)